MTARQRTYRIALLAACACVNLGCGARNTSAVDPLDLQMRQDSLMLASYPFLDTSADTLLDPAGNLAPFFAKLRRLDTRSESDTTIRVNIVHFGDSHVQADAFPDVVMRRLQVRFGCAGRGMIVPHKLSGSNEPRDYAIRAEGEWFNARLARKNDVELPLGLTGIAVQGKTPENKLWLCNIPVRDGSAPYVDYRFDHIRVFHAPTAPIIEAPRSLSLESDVSGLLYDFVTEIDLLKPADTMMLNTHAQGSFAEGPFYGFSLENYHSGVLYHALGANGACYLHWGRQREVARQSAALAPDLIIISLGSNEAAGNNFIDDVFYREIDLFVGSLRSANPGASILLTSPAEAFKKGNPNPNYGHVSRTLARYAADHGLAFVDLYAAGGGEGSAKLWNDNALMGRDRIHYTVDGYRLQGLLLYNALYKGYLNSLIPAGTPATPMVSGTPPADSSGIAPRTP